MKLNLDRLKVEDLKNFRTDFTNNETVLTFVPEGTSPIVWDINKMNKAKSLFVSAGYHEQQNYASRVAVTRDKPEEFSGFMQQFCRPTHRLQDGWILAFASVGSPMDAIRDGIYKMDNGTEITVSVRGITARNIHTKNIVWGIK